MSTILGRVSVVVIKIAMANSYSLSFAYMGHNCCAKSSNLFYSVHVVTVTSFCLQIATHRRHVRGIYYVVSCNRVTSYSMLANRCVWIYTWRANISWHKIYQIFAFNSLFVHITRASNGGVFYAQFSDVSAPNVRYSCSMTYVSHHYFFVTMLTIC